MTANGDIYKFQIPEEREGISEAELKKSGIDFEDDYDQEGEKESSEDLASRGRVVNLATLRRIEDFKLRKFGARGASVIASLKKAA